MRDPSLPERIKAFVDTLFTNGAGEIADRLVLTIDGPPKRDLGGWCRAAIVVEIRKAFEVPDDPR